MVACPLDGLTKPQSIRMVVVFPAPLAPRNPKIVPCSIDKRKIFHGPELAIGLTKPTPGK